MATMTLAVPDELKREMAKFPEISWSEVARRAFEEKIKDMKFLEWFKSGNMLSEEDALKLGKEVQRAINRVYGIKH
jgi:predicted CopG family antitoxin